MEVNVLGGGWITSHGYGTMKTGDAPLPGKGKPVLPPAKEIFSEPLKRYGRFDTYTKLGCAAVALALKDARLDQIKENRPTGIVISTRYECFESDLVFYETILDEGGFLSSPNLFSYTLPGIVMGECAIHFKLTGPTFSVGESDGAAKGFNALRTALNMLCSGTTDTMIAGWLDSPPDSMKESFYEGDIITGAVFVVLSSSSEHKKSFSRISYENSRIIFSYNNKKISSLLDLFPGKD